MSIEIKGFFGLLLLIADVWAVVHIAQSAASVGAKTAWIVVVLVFPVIGLAAWFFFGPRGK